MVLEGWTQCRLGRREPGIRPHRDDLSCDSRTGNRPQLLSPNPRVNTMARTCVFCGATPLSREHVFPRWLRDVLPEQEPRRGQDFAIVTGDSVNAMDLPVETREVREVFTETKVARVCRSCNHGWMNELEGAARDALTMLIQGRRGRIGQEKVKTLATWVAKTSMMAEFTHPESAVTPADHYRWLFDHQTPPPGMMIWALPAAADDWALRMQHYGILYGFPETVDVSEACNTQSTVIGLGKVAFCLMSTSDPTLDLPSLDQIPPLAAVRLWPEPKSFWWDYVNPLGSADLWFVSDYLRLWIGDDDELLMSRMVDLAFRLAASVSRSAVATTRLTRQADATPSA
jgi:hypothetical protein